MARMGHKRKVFKGFVGMPEGKRSLGRPRCRREHGITMDLGEIVWDVECVQLALDRDRRRTAVNGVMTLRVLAPRSEIV